MVVVGWYVGPAGISAVQVSGQVMLILTNMIAGLAMGATVLIGQYQGAGKEQDQKETIGTLMTLFLIIGVIATGIMMAVSSPVLRLLRTPQEAWEDARQYLLICTGGLIFLFGYNAIASVLRGMGDSIRPLIFIGIAAAVNIGLDFLFVGVFGWRAAGAAWATVISQAVSLLTAVIYLKRKKFVFDFRLKSFRLYRGKTGLIFRIGLPTTIQFSITGLSFLTLTGICQSYWGCGWVNRIGYRISN